MVSRTQLERRFVDLLELPPDVLLELPKLTLSGNRQLTLENHRGLIEYEPERIRIRTKHGEVKIAGAHLCIKAIAKEEIVVAGRITGVELAGWGVEP